MRTLLNKQLRSTIQCTKRSLENLTNHAILSQLVGHGRKVFACGALRRWLESGLHEVLIGVILVPQDNTEYYVQRKQNFNQ